MRKSNFLCFLDNIFWYFIMLFPLIIYFILLGQGSSLNFSGALSFIGFDILTTNNIIYTTLLTIFTDYLGLTSSVSFVQMLCYIGLVQISHFILDMILCLVKVGHNLLNKATKEF